jgi:hypothetical protein
VVGQVNAAFVPDVNHTMNYARKRRNETAFARALTQRSPAGWIRRCFSGLRSLQARCG